MEKNQNQNSIKSNTPEHSPRIIVSPGEKNLWQGCLYFSSIDLTGEILLLLKTHTTNSKGKFLNRPIYFFSSTNRSIIDFKISETIKSHFNIQSSTSTQEED